MHTTPAHEVSPAAPASAGARAGGDVWAGFATELAQLAKLARTAETAGEFYSELLRRAVAALAAEGGAVWTPDVDGPMRRLCLVDAGGPPPDDAQRDAHERLLGRVAATRAPRVFAPQSSSAGAASANPLPTVLVAAPVLPAHGAPDAPPAAIIELNLAPGASPNSYQGAERFAAELADVAGEFHAFSDLVRLRAACDEQRSMLTLGERVHRRGRLRTTAMTIANEARDAVGCDRVSVLAARGKRSARLLAVSGVDRHERRSRAVRGLERVAAVCRTLAEPLYLADDQEDALPQAAEALHAYADISHARQVAVVPLTDPGDAEATERQGDADVFGVLVAEKFDGAAADIARDRVTEAARVCAPALRNALEFDAVPLAGALRAARRWTRPGALAKCALALAVVAAVVAALILTPAELRVDARGELQPVVRSNMFAPGDGIVERVAVAHGQQVRRGDVLVQLRDPELDLEIKRVDGELATTRRQLDAVRATRASVDQRDADAVEGYRLSAEQQQLAQRLTALEAQRDLLEAQRDDLTVTSPLDGAVVTWGLEESLFGRPVERGQALLTVADTQGAWRVELELPDDRIGYLIDAQQAAGDDALTVEFRLGSQESGFATGRVRRVAQRAESPSDGAAPGAARTVLVYVEPDKPLATHSQPGDVRPGASVRARVLCGKRALGYVLLHDVINAARVWWEF